MTDSPNTQLAMQRAQKRREQVPATPETDIEAKLQQSLSIGSASVQELLDMRKAINAELASREERLDAERSRIARDLAALQRAGIARPRATRKDKGMPRTRPELRLTSEPTYVTDPGEI